MRSLWYYVLIKKKVFVYIFCTWKLLNCLSHPGYIDLSKRRVAPEDVVKCEDRYNKAKAVHSVLRHVAATFNKNLEHLYTVVGWPLYKKYGHAYDAFKLALT